MIEITIVVTSAGWIVHQLSETSLSESGHRESLLESPDKLWPCDTRRGDQGAKHQNLVNVAFIESLGVVANVRVVPWQETNEKARWQSVR